MFDFRSVNGEGILFVSSLRSDTAVSPKTRSICFLGNITEAVEFLCHCRVEELSFLCHFQRGICKAFLVKDLQQVAFR